METWMQMIITVLCSLIVSTGFWAVVQKIMDKKDNTKALLIGLAHDRIIYLGMSYIKRGSITKDEYENLYQYLYLPYSKFGGNGTAEKVMTEVKKLPICYPEDLYGDGSNGRTSKTACQTC